MNKKKGVGQSANALGGTVFYFPPLFEPTGRPPLSRVFGGWRCNNVQWYPETAQA